MEKWVIVSLIMLMGIALIGILIFIFYWKVYQISEIGENCSIIIENEGENKIDVVFFTDGVNKNRLNEYINFFLSSEPYINHKNKFNFFYAGAADCKIIEDFIFCYSKETLKKSSSCPNDYIIVLSNQYSKIRSSSYINLISLNINNPPNVILHEFGHVFANLADEYTPSTIPSGSKNCRKKCSDFNNLEDCFEGCSKSNYQRSSENSLMRISNSDEYKKLNTLLIEERLEKYG
ncbi:MAG: M64 family metallopeptidase [Nanoarchaeota archaeon]